MKPRILIALLFLCVTALLLWGSSCTQVIAPPVNGEPDTTSHDFTFETFVLGDGNSSTLYDVAIINDTLAYAVGEIYLKDSTGQFDPDRYNTAIWDGKTWQPVRANVNFRGNIISPPLEGIFVFSPSDIWLVGSLPIHGNGQQWTIYDLRTHPAFSDISLSKAWGTSSTSIYFTGRNGSLVYYNGGWQKIESGTTMDIRDIHGYVDAFNGKTVLLGVASSPSGVKVLSLSQSTASDTLAWKIANPLNSIWVSNNLVSYVAGPGIWKYIDTTWQQITGLPSEFYSKVRGTGGNNIFVVGGNVLAHYNGAGWHAYDGIPSNFRLRSVAVSKNMVVAVGNTVTGLIIGNAAIVVGRRVK